MTKVNIVDRKVLELKLLNREQKRINSLNVKGFRKYTEGYIDDSVDINVDNLDTAKSAYLNYMDEIYSTYSEEELEEALAIPADDLTETRTFIKYSDAKHGWLEVEKSDLKLLELEEEISIFSYISRDESKVYLEEDNDLPLFLTKYLNKFGKLPKIVELYDGDSSPIRNMGIYRC